MALRNKSLINSVLALPEPERIELIQQVLTSLEPGVDDLTDEAWEKELDRRSAELRADPTAGIPWAKVKKMR